MSAFPCRECGCVENTACCNYWSLRSDGKPLLCSACDPEIGQWHGQFERRSASGMQVDTEGHLWSLGAIPPRHLTILGVVLPAKDPA